MKKLFSVLFVFLLAGGTAFADGKEDLFAIDEAALQEEFAELDELEAYVTENGGTYESVAQNAGHLLENINLRADNVAGVLAGAGAMDDSPLGIPPFLWGFCFGVVGIAIVYFVAEDSDLTKKAFIGCVVGYAIYAVIYFVLIAGSIAAN
ncbi:MAG: hypothetical protein WBA12_05920 [Catalinimonas sp.]